MKNYIVPLILGVSVIGFALGPAYGLNLYNRFLGADKLLHLSGGFISVWFLTLYLKDILQDTSLFKRLLIAISLAAFIGIIWEFAEFFSTIYTPSLHNYFRIGDLYDTLGDMAADMCGGLLFGIIFMRRK